MSKHGFFGIIKVLKNEKQSLLLPYKTYMKVQ